MYIVVAAGNEGGAGMSDPGRQPHVLSVGAVDQNNKVAEFSSWQVGGQDLDIVSYGVGIESTVPGNRYMALSGTSMAAPVVSGLVGNLLKAFIKNGLPLPTQSELETLLQETAIDVDIPGFDKKGGHGIPDIFAAYNRWAETKDPDYEPPKEDTKSVLLKILDMFFDFLQKVKDFLTGNATA